MIVQVLSNFRLDYATYTCILFYYLLLIIRSLQNAITMQQKIFDVWNSGVGPVPNVDWFRQKSDISQWTFAQRKRCQLCRQRRTLYWEYPFMNHTNIWLKRECKKSNFKNIWFFNLDIVMKYIIIYKLNLIVYWILWNGRTKLYWLTF